MTPTPASDLRLAFEEHLRKIWTAGYSAPRIADGSYLNKDAEGLWQTFRAGAIALDRARTPTPASNLSDEEILDAIEHSVAFASPNPTQYIKDQIEFARAIEAKVLDRARATAEPVAIAEVIEADRDELEARIRWLLNPCPVGTVLYELPVGATVAPSPAPTIHTDFCWLVELRSPHITTPIYHTGFVTLSGESRSTKLPQEAKRYPTKEAAQRVAIKLGFTLAGTWEAIEHGFERAASGASPEPTARALEKENETLRLHIQRLTKQRDALADIADPIEPPPDHQVEAPIQLPDVGGTV